MAHVNRVSPERSSLKMQLVGPRWSTLHGLSGCRGALHATGMKPAPESVVIPGATTGQGIVERRRCGVSALARDRA